MAIVQPTVAQWPSAHAVAKPDEYKVGHNSFFFSGNRQGGHWRARFITPFARWFIQESQGTGTSPRDSYPTCSPPSQSRLEAAV